MIPNISHAASVDLHAELLEKNRRWKGAYCYLPGKSQFGAFCIWPNRKGQLLTSRDEIKMCIKKIIIVKNNTLEGNVTIDYKSPESYNTVRGSILLYSVSPQFCCY